MCVSWGCLGGALGCLGVPGGCLGGAFGSRMLENAVPVHKIKGCLEAPWGASGVLFGCHGAALGCLGEALGCLGGAFGVAWEAPGLPWGPLGCRLVVAGCALGSQGDTQRLPGVAPGGSEGYGGHRAGTGSPISGGGWPAEKLKLGTAGTQAGRKQASWLG